jgi:hypothetical protein
MRDGVYTPPDGYRFCHETLNKDAPHRGHGAEPIMPIMPNMPSGPTYHAVAVRLAEDGTGALWEALRAGVTTNAGPARAGEALAHLSGQMF